MFEDFTPNFGNKRTGCCITTTHNLTKQFLTKNNMTVLLHPPYFSLFHRLKTKLKGLYFDTVEVIEAESQVVLNSFREYDFQDAFNK
jgi:hypothetical protein